MTEELISFETAKLAKEKGFNEDCEYNYDMNGEIHHIGKQNHNSHQLKISAPTQSLLQRWLREIKQIDICVNSVRFTGHEEIGYYTYSIKSIVPTKNYRFDTYEQALEEGLKQALTLIE